jgi:transposase
MQVVHPICCGLDVHQAQLTACLRRVDTDGQVTTAVREFATTYDALLTLSEWLIEQQCPVVALESTGVYWRPVYHVLVGTVEVLVGHAQEMRWRPGHKTDKADARWIAELLARGTVGGRARRWAAPECRRRRGCHGLPGRALCAGPAG